MSNIWKIFDKVCSTGFDKIYKEQNKQLYEKFKKERDRSNELFRLSFSRLQRINEMRILLSDLRGVVVSDLDNAYDDEEVLYYSDLLMRIDNTIGEK